MVGLSQREAGEQGLQNWMLVAVLLVEFVVEGNLGMKDATCHVDNKSHYLVLSNIPLNDLILLDITQGPVAMLTTFKFPSLLTYLSFLAGRSIGSSNGTSSCPLFRRDETRESNLVLLEPDRLRLDVASCSSRSSFSNSTCARRAPGVALLNISDHRIRRSTPRLEC